MPTPTDAKSQALRRQGALHPHPRDVTDALFRSREFFDPRDLVQVKYEMLRRVHVEGCSIVEVVAAFGFSRPTFYQAQAAYRRHGLPGLIPRRPGPRRAHKLSEDVVGFALRQQARDPSLRAPTLAAMTHEGFGLDLHPRSIERALARRRKKGR
jgi:transposase